MTRIFGDEREIGGRDPIDAALSPAPEVAAGISHLIWRRVALGLAPTVAPALLFVPLGLLLGPLASNVISPRMLVRLDPVVSMALATLGVFVGLALDLREPDDRRWLGAAAVESLVTMGVLGFAASVLFSFWALPLGRASIGVAAMLAICGAASSAAWADEKSDPRLHAATRIADLDDVVPVVAAAALLAAVRAASAQETLVLTLVTIALGSSVGLVGWLLFERAHGDAERIVFVVGVVAMLGGVAAALRLSPLLTGLVAGLVWTYSPGRADRVIAQQLRKLQHPLVVLLLLVSGASVVPSLLALWLTVPYVAFRLTGKLAGGWMASRLLRRLAPADLGALLVPPGLLGVAFALNFHQAIGGATGSALLTAVVAGTLVSEFLAWIVVPAWGKG
jgi:hypothetical protein